MISKQILTYNTESAKSISKGLQALGNYDILDFKAQGDEIYLRMKGNVPHSVMTKLERLSWIVVDTDKQDEIEFIYPLI